MKFQANFQHIHTAKTYLLGDAVSVLLPRLSQALLCCFRRTYLAQIQEYLGLLVFAWCPYD